VRGRALGTGVADRIKDIADFRDGLIARDSGWRMLTSEVEGPIAGTWVAHISRDETMMPGEFIGSGTVGNGCGLELGWFLEHGDRTELELKKIGVLKNWVERQDISSASD
jgi:hypothetical protein